MDIATVYYRESPRLSQIQPGVEVSKKACEPIKGELTLREGSLLNICFNFIAVNLNLIDSLVGLPEVIGRQLFIFMLRKNIFKFDVFSTDDWTPQDKLKWKVLSMFDEAYTGLVLKTVSLANLDENFGINPILNSFRNLVELDLSGRVLADEVLCSIPRLRCLKKLILQKNKLNHKSISKLTLPYRLYKENSQELEILDISFNEQVFNRSLELLLTFSMLKILNLTCTSIKMNYSMVYELKQFGWQISRNEPTYDKPETVGWAKGIISDLEFQSANNTVAKSSKAQTFYFGNKKEELAEKQGTEILNLTRNWFPTHPPKFNRKVLLDPNENSISHNQTKRKRARISPVEKSKGGSRPLNAVSNNTNFALPTFYCDDEDGEDIMNQYSGSKPQSGKKCFLECLNDL